MKQINRLQQPDYQDIEYKNAIRLEHHKLKNGIPLVLLRADEQQVVKINFRFRVGAWVQDAPLVASFTAALLREGTQEMNSQQIAEKLDFYGAFLTTDSGKHYSNVTLYSLLKFLPKTLPILEQTIKKPVFDKNEFEILRTNRRQGFMVQRLEVENLADEQLYEQLFGKNHPYGKQLRQQDFDNLKQKQLFEFFERYYHSGNCQIIVSGKLDSETLGLIDNAFGGNDWESKGFTPSEKQYEIEPAKAKFEFIEKQDAVQSAVRTGQIMINRKHQDYIGLQILNTIFGGFFGSRLMRNIREDKGYSYGIYSGLHSLEKAGVLLISTEVGTQFTKKTIAEIEKEIKILKNELVGEEELKLVKNYSLGDMMRHLNGAFAYSEVVKTILDYQLPENYYENYAKIIKNIDAETLNRLANQYFTDDLWYQTVAGRMD